MGGATMLSLLRGVLAAGFMAVSLSSFSATVQGYFYEVKGDVKATVGTAAPVTVSKSQHVVDGTTVSTGTGGTAILKFVDGTVIALAQNTSFLVQKYNFEEANPSAISSLYSLTRGALRVITGLVSQRNREAFKLSTTVATIGIRGTEFLAAMGNSLTVQVQAGVVGVTNAAGTVAVSAGSAVTVASATALAVPTSAVPGSFSELMSMQLPPATPGAVPGAGAAASGAAAGGIGVTGLGIAAAAVAAAVAVSGSDDGAQAVTGTTTTGTTGTTGSTGTR